MKKTYTTPEIWVENMITERSLLGESITEVIKTEGNASLIYGGGGSGPARSGESSLWDDSDDSDWDHL